MPIGHVFFEEVELFFPFFDRMDLLLLLFLLSLVSAFYILEITVLSNVWWEVISCLSEGNLVQWSIIYNSHDLVIAKYLERF